MRIQDALARLMRAGDEHSKSSEKLKEAARMICDQVLASGLEDRTWLPKGYIVREMPLPNTTPGKLAIYPEPMQTPNVPWLPVGYGLPASLLFAQDVAAGLMNEISMFLEQRAMESAAATETLRRKGAIDWSEGSWSEFQNTAGGRMENGALVLTFGSHDLVLEPNGMWHLLM